MPFLLNTYYLYMLNSHNDYYMQFENIRILAKKEELKVINGILTKFEKIIPYLKYASKNVGELSDRSVVSIRIDVENYQKLVEIFVMNGIKVLAIDDKTKQLIDSIKSKLREGIVSEELEKDVRRTNVNPIKDDELDILAKDGNYEEIKRLSKDIINFSENFVKKIGDLLELAINNAIDKAINEVEKDTSKINSSLEKLLKISSDLSLRTFNKVELSCKAGEAAIEICQYHLDFFKKLIDIGNKNGLPNGINLKAVVKFAELVMDDQDFFAEDISYAIKNLNLKWLALIWEVGEKLLSSEEKQKYSEFIKFVESNKA